MTEAQELWLLEMSHLVSVFKLQRNILKLRSLIRQCVKFHYGRHRRLTEAQELWLLEMERRRAISRVWRIRRILWEKIMFPAVTVFRPIHDNALNLIQFHHAFPDNPAGCSAVLIGVLAKKKCATDYHGGLKFTYHCSARCFRTICAEIPSFSARNRIFLRFLCIAKRVTGHGVNSNGSKPLPRQSIGKGLYFPSIRPSVRISFQF